MDQRNKASAKSLPLRNIARRSSAIFLSLSALPADRPQAPPASYSSLQYTSLVAEVGKRRERPLRSDGWLFCLTSDSTSQSITWWVNGITASSVAVCLSFGCPPPQSARILQQRQAVWVLPVSLAWSGMYWTRVFQWKGCYYTCSGLVVKITDNLLN